MPLNFDLLVAFPVCVYYAGIPFDVLARISAIDSWPLPVWARPDSPALSPGLTARFFMGCKHCSWHIKLLIGHCQKLTKSFMYPQEPGCFFNIFGKDIAMSVLFPTRKFTYKENYYVSLTYRNNLTLAHHHGNSKDFHLEFKAQFLLYKEIFATHIF